MVDVTIENKTHHGPGKLGLAIILLAALTGSLVALGKEAVFLQLVLLAMLAAGIFLAFMGQFYLVMALLIWLPFQNIVLALLVLGQVVPVEVTKYLYLLKEIVVILVLGFAIIKSYPFRLPKTAILFLAFTLMVGLYILLGDMPAIPKIAGGRMLVMPIMVFLLGLFLRLPPDGEKYIQRTWYMLVAIYVLVAYIGFVELFMIPSEQMGALQHAMHLGKGMSTPEVITGSVGTFYTVFVSRFDGSVIWIRRMISTYLEPLMLGHALILPMVFLIFNLIGRKPFLSKPLSVVLFTIVGLTQAFSLSRGAILASMIGGLVLIYLERRIRIYWLFLPLFLLSVIYSIPPLRIFVVNTILLRDPSSYAHAQQLIKGWQLLLQNPLGLGLGHGGYVGVLFTEGASEGSGESFYFSLTSQVGLIGLGLFSLGLIFLLSNLYSNYIKSRSSWLGISSLILFATIIGQSISAIFSEAALGIQASAAVWLLAGMMVRLGNQANSSPSHRSP